MAHVTIVNDNHMITSHIIMNNNIAAAITNAVVNNHITTIVKDYAVTNDHRITNDNGFMDNHGLANNHRVTDVRPFHYGNPRDGQGDLVEQRLAMAEAVEVQANQAAPVTFEDEEFFRIVVTPDFTAVDLVAALVDDAEFVAILQHGRIVDLHFNVQVFLRPCLCRCGRSRAGLIEPRYSLMMPGWSERKARAWICGLCDSQATQNTCYGE